MVGVYATPLGPLSTSPPLITIYSCKQSSEILICSPHKKPHLLNMFLPNSNDITTTFSSKLESLVGDKTEKQSSKLTCPKWALQLMLQNFSISAAESVKISKQIVLFTHSVQFYWLLNFLCMCNCERYCVCHCCSLLQIQRTNQEQSKLWENYFQICQKNVLNFWQ